MKRPSQRFTSPLEGNIMKIIIRRCSIKQTVRSYVKETVELFQIHFGIRPEIEDGTDGELSFYLNDQLVLQRTWYSLPTWHEIEYAFAHHDEWVQQAGEMRVLH